MSRLQLVLFLAALTLKVGLCAPVPRRVVQRTDHGNAHAARVLPPAAGGPVLRPDLLEMPRGPLLWADEFTGPTIDADIWDISVENPAVNDEEQSYEADNVFQQGGMLVLEGKEGGSTFGMPYSSGKVTTTADYGISYGHIEIRMKVCKGQGTWPSVFMLPIDWAYGVWPQSGEIDIFEAVNNAMEPHGSMHYGGVFEVGTKGQNGCIMKNNLDYSLDFHVYTLSWTPGVITWGIDGRDYCAASTWFSESPDAMGNPAAPYDKPFSLILNLALGGGWPGPVDPLQAPFQMLFDYVRVYDLTPTQKNDSRDVFPGAVWPAPPALNTGVPVPYYTEEEDGGFVPWRVPTTIDAESFDIGGEGIGYHDLTPLINTGSNRFRPYDGVDLGEGDIMFPPGGQKFGGSNGPFVKDFEAGEWLSYTILLEAATTLEGTVWAASVGPGIGRISGVIDTDDCSDEAALLFSVPIKTPTKEAFDFFKWKSAMPLTAGVHRIVVCSVSGNVNFNQLGVTTPAQPVQVCGEIAICWTGPVR
eukprot:TRINITY_DN2546_c0_g1_i1.p1 TRINITY_DN2546_c0_g1~~TRINITY_DN2546_c0_g1_i1.p1  ORF type:complete len:576 (-),score=92.13 TRINITY_DN2546_c0_g1_i1:562-2148(-)